MLSTFFRPGHLKEADLMARNARKLLHRRRDLLTDAQFEDYSSQITELEQTVRNEKGADRQQVEDMVERIDKNFSKVQPAQPDAGMRENCEVILVALVLAIGIRAYFLQPFKIPTGSMQPTLNGIIAVSVDPQEKLPGFFTRALQYLWLGRTYADAVSEQDDKIVRLEPIKHLGFLNYTRISCASGRRYDVYVPKEKMSPGQADSFELYEGRTLKKGESIVHGYVSAGDQVFVDKFTYNFRFPRAEDVFVFSTAGILGTRRPDMDTNVKSEYYIKRLAGLPGDTLRVAHPQLFINGSLAKGKYFERVMAAKDGYRGYSNTIGRYLTSSGDTFTVPAESYFAMGDNSYNSSDSRAWGVVPARNVVGRGLFVYYPFTWHWGPIH